MIWIKFWWTKTPSSKSLPRTLLSIFVIVFLNYELSIQKPTRVQRRGAAILFRNRWQVYSPSHVTVNVESLPYWRTEIPEAHQKKSCSKVFQVVAVERHKARISLGLFLSCMWFYLKTMLWDALISAWPRNASESIRWKTLGQTNRPHPHRRQEPRILN